jgi:hypothetical protein
MGSISNGLFAGARRIKDYNTIGSRTDETEGNACIRFLLLRDQNEVPPPNMNCCTTSYFPFVTGTA